jgi:hypothetical protein
MKLISLQSGSNGNCLYVEAGGVKPLFDAGISGSQVHERLSSSPRLTLKTNWRIGSKANQTCQTNLPITPSWDNGARRICRNKSLTSS